MCWRVSYLGVLFDALLIVSISLHSSYFLLFHFVPPTPPFFFGCVSFFSDSFLKESMEGKMPCPLYIRICLYSYSHFWMIIWDWKLFCFITEGVAPLSFNLGCYLLRSQCHSRPQSFICDSKSFHFHALEKEMATRSSVFAWRIPGMGEPGGLPSMGSHRVGHDWSDLAAKFVHWKLLLSSLFLVHCCESFSI